MGELTRTKEYLPQRYGFAANRWGMNFLIWSIVSISLIALSKRFGGEATILVTTTIGLGSAAVLAVGKLLQRRLKKSSSLPGIRSDLVAAGRELYDLSESTNLSRRVDPQIGRALERAAEATLATLHAIQVHDSARTSLAGEVEPAVHEAMHQAMAVALPFFRPVGTGKSRHEGQILHLELVPAVEEIDLLTEKIRSVRVAITGSADQPLLLDQTLARLQELKQAEAELDQIAAR